MSTEDEDDRGRSLSATKDEDARGSAREDTVGTGLLSPSLSLFKLRVKSSIGPLLLPGAPLWPLIWETGVLLRSLKDGATGDILTGCRPYSILSLQHKVKRVGNKYQEIQYGVEVTDTTCVCMQRKPNHRHIRECIIALSFHCDRLCSSLF